jgi:DNA-binding XRE family transcriptional regulator
MGKATFPFNLTNNLDKFVRMKQAELMSERGKKVTLTEVYDLIGEKCGVTGFTVSMLKSGSYNPSVILAFILAGYFKTTVDDLFSIVPKEEDDAGGQLSQSDNQ